MKNKLIMIAGALALVVILARVFEKPLVAQIRAALTQNIDEPGRNPFAFQAPGLNERAFYVPAGKRYVIQQATVECLVPNSTYMTGIRVIAHTGDANNIATAPAHQEESYIGKWGGTATTSLYADSGAEIYVEAVFAANVPSDGCEFYISGYAINNP